MKKYTVLDTTPDSEYREIKLIRVDFHGGIAFEILNYGATIRSIEMSDKAGNRENVVLSYNTLKEYLNDQVYLGCTVGRFANRISQGRFNIGGEAYQLTVNNNGNHLHGGNEGFNRKIWKIEHIEERTNEVSIKLCCESKDGEEGYPGNLLVKVEYLIQKASIEIIYSASTDKDTLFNPTNHTYFNLSGNALETINSHLLKIASMEYLELMDQIPTGNRLNVDKTVFDFRNEKPITSYCYDDCFALKGEITLNHKESGRQVHIETSLPGIQLYTGDFLSMSGFKNRSGVCLEPQFFPDSPNHEGFPTTVLKPGDVFDNHIKYAFSTNQTTQFSNQ